MHWPRCDMKTELFWVIYAGVVAISYRRFGTVYLAHLQGGSRIQNLLDSCHVMTQKSAVLILRDGSVKSLMVVCYSQTDYRQDNFSNNINIGMYITVRPTNVLIIS